MQMLDYNTHIVIWRKCSILGKLLRLEIDPNVLLLYTTTTASFTFLGASLVGPFNIIFKI